MTNNDQKIMNPQPSNIFGESVEFCVKLFVFARTFKSKNQNLHISVHNVFFFGSIMVITWF